MPGPVMNEADLEEFLHREFPQAFYPGSGLTIEQAEHGRARVRLGYSEKFIRPGGTVDAIHTSGQDIFDSIQAAPDKFTFTPEAEGHKEVAYGLVNTAKPPFNDLETRMKMGEAIDRNKLNDINSSGLFKVANGPFDTKVMGYLKDPGVPAYNPDDAAKFFKGKNISINLSYATDPTTKAIADDVKRQLENVGITVNIDDKDQATLINQALGGNFNVLLWRNHPGADPDTQYNWWYGGSPVNFARINDPKMNELLDQGRTETDPAKRKQIYEDFNQAFRDGAYSLWNWYSEWGIGSYKTVHNLTGTTLPDGKAGSGMTWGWHLLTETWVDQ